MHETSGGKAKLDLELNFSAKGWREASLMEEPVGDFHEGRTIARELKPFEIFTVLVDL
jgi:hypothetical protein